MNTIQLINDLSRNGATRRHFYGVFPSDLLPKEKLLKPALVIANTGDSRSSGMHWISFYFPVRGRGEYFDSFGNAPVVPYFIEFLERNSSSTYINNTRQVQGNFSTTCGAWCAVYLYYRCLGKTMKQFLRMFSPKKFDFNDDKIIHLYQQHFHHHEPRTLRTHGISGGGNDDSDGVCGNYLPYNQNCLPRCSTIRYFEC